MCVRCIEADDHRSGPDVDSRLRALARERGIPLRKVINEALRSAIDPTPGKTPTAYVLPSRDLSVRPGVNHDKAWR